MKTFSGIYNIVNTYNDTYRKLMRYFTGFAKPFCGDKVALQFLTSSFRVFNVFKN